MQWEWEKSNKIPVPWYILRPEINSESGIVNHPVADNSPLWDLPVLHLCLSILHSQHYNLPSLRPHFPPKIHLAAFAHQNFGFHHLLNDIWDRGESNNLSKMESGGISLQQIHALFAVWFLSFIYRHDQRYYRDCKGNYLQQGLAKGSKCTH